MVELKLEAVIFSLTFCFLLCTAARKTSRDASHIGYLYDKPGQSLEVPRDFEGAEEETSTEEIGSTRKPAERPHDEYLPPRLGALSHRLREDEEHSKRLDNEKRDLHKNKEKLPKQQFPFQGARGGGVRHKSGLRFEN